MQVIDSPLEIASFPSEGYEMASNKETLQNHESRLQEIETQLGIKPPIPKKTAKERLTEWVKANPYLSLALSIILTAFTVFGGYWLNHHNEWRNHDIDERVRTVLETPGGIKETLNQVRDTVNATKTTLDTLKPYIEDVTRHQFENVASLPSKTLGQRLPAVQHLIAVAKEQKIKPETPALNTLGRKLSAVDTNAVDFWSTAGEFISYRSFIVVGNLQNWNKQFSPCPSSGVADLLGKNKGMGVQAVDKSGNPIPGSERTIERLSVQDCLIELDGKTISKWDCVKCLVKYSGGAVSLTDVNFTDCLFVFELSSKPSAPEGERLVQTILASNAQKVAIGG